MKVACLLDTDFEDSEFQKPYEALRQAGHEVTIIGLEAGKTLHGRHGEVETRTELGIEDVRPEQYDALLIPGGNSPDHLRADMTVVRFAASMVRANKPTFAICHGAQLLLTADVVQGRKMTAWQTVQTDLAKAGARVLDQEVVVDDNLVTSRKPADIPAFNREMLALLQQRQGQRQTAQSM